MASVIAYVGVVQNREYTVISTVEGAYIDAFKSIGEIRSKINKSL